MNKLELAILNVNGEHLRLEMYPENLPCKKLGNYIIYCTNYDYKECNHSCKYALGEAEKKK